MSKPLAFKSIGFLLITYLAMLTALVTTRFITSDMNAFDPVFRDKYWRWLPIIMSHGVCGITALVLGPFQLSTKLRRRSLKAHRIVGRIYVVAMMVGGVTGLFMATIAYGGWVTQLGLTGLAIAWLGTGVLAWRTAVGRRLVAHRKWAIRNYALTFAAVTLRIYLNICVLAGFEYLEVYRVVAWLSWIPTLLFVEYIILPPLSGAPSKFPKFLNNATETRRHGEKLENPSTFPPCPPVSSYSNTKEY